MTTPSNKTNSGNFFEDFRIGQVLAHATPRTVTEGDIALYTALYGPRFAVQSSAAFATGLGFEDMPADDLLAFHIVFGKTVPDISLNAVANLGYADGTFGVPVYAGDTITTTSTVIGLKENSNGRTGVVYVRSRGVNQQGEMVVDYVRWVMVNKRDAATPAPAEVVPDLPKTVPVAALKVPAGVSFDSEAYDTVLAGSPHLWDDYTPGEKIDHVDGMTIEEAEHMLATRLYQNTAKVHFNQFEQAKGRFGKRLIYGGHIISLARALSFNGLGNACKLVAINAGSHCNPTFSGDTIHCWTEVLEKAAFPERADVGALRLRTVATKDLPCAGHPYKDAEGKYLPNVVLDFDYWVLMPRR
ncbi:MaoC family dehydratase [Novispirillum itersonii]|uniref:2-methylfumaryl-CoA hydratase n=1 Tax=Novispirillum itersonii TaxID=189 RepID=A0A7X0DK80_NOVIT|nr:MaoC family dehydratase [Novispirillum itersonii]MBB6208680.1 2-methylfumaryl-CoA hydratase [Novispirillum itersonii]